MNNSAPIIAHIVPRYTRYGTNGYYCYAVGHDTFFARTMKIAKEWANKFGLDIVKI